MIKDLILQGTALQVEAGDVAEATKTGTLRGGSCGLLTDKGDFLGACPVEAYLRFKGVKISKTTISQELMFAGGRLNEIAWLDSLKQSYKGPILCEEEIPVVWETGSGIKVTGRPDIVLCDDVDGTPVPKCGIELKQVMSPFTANHVLFKKEPMLKHLIQTSWYMSKLNVPFELWYTNRNSVTCAAYMGHMPIIPSPGAKDSEHLDYRYYKLGPDINWKSKKPTRRSIKVQEYNELVARYGYDKFSYASAKGDKKSLYYASEPKRFIPFLQGYELDIHNDTVYIKDAMVDSAKWTETCVKISHIENWYNHISNMEKANVIPSSYRNVNCYGEDTGFKFDSELGTEMDPASHVGEDLGRYVNQVTTMLERGKK